MKSTIRGICLVILIIVCNLSSCNYSNANYVSSKSVVTIDDPGQGNGEIALYYLNYIPFEENSFLSAKNYVNNDFEYSSKVFCINIDGSYKQLFCVNKSISKMSLSNKELYLGLVEIVDDDNYQVDRITDKYSIEKREPNGQIVWNLALDYAVNEIFHLNDKTLLKTTKKIVIEDPEYKYYLINKNGQIEREWENTIISGAYYSEKNENYYFYTIENGKPVIQIVRPDFSLVQRYELANRLEEVLHFDFTHDDEIYVITTDKVYLMAADQLIEKLDMTKTPKERAQDNYYFIPTSFYALNDLEYMIIGDIKKMSSSYFQSYWIKFVNNYSELEVSSLDITNSSFNIKCAFQNSPDNLVIICKDYDHGKWKISIHQIETIW